MYRASRTIALALGWLLFFFVAYKVATTTMEEKGLWDPYEILGVRQVIVYKKIFPIPSKLQT